MNIIQIITKKLVVVLPFVLLLLSSNTSSAKTTESDVEIDWQNRINNITSHVDLRLTPQVKKSIDLYTSRHRTASENLLGRVSVYFPIIENSLRAKSLPDELKYIAVIESSLEVRAKSYIGASGLWQFMKGTGKMYGLTINSAVDERRDVEKATDAALEYLSDLYEQFDDWTLAIAAYNCGPGNLRKAIRKAGGSKDFWTLQKYLPKETQKYVPKFIAAAYLMNYYHDHDLVPALVEDELKFTATSMVYEHLDFKNLSKETGLDVEIIKFLNPSYLKGYIPKSVAGRKLILPETEMYAYLDVRAAYDKLLYTSASMYYGKELLAGRKLERSSDLAISSLPTRSFTQVFSNDNDFNDNYDYEITIEDSNMYLPTEYMYHQLQKRESLYSVSEQYDGVSFNDLIQLNGVDFTNAPKAGSVIMIKKM